jgi:hypothetical protein
MSPIGDLADQPVMHILVAEHPATAVEIYHNRWNVGAALWSDDAVCHFTFGAAGNGAVLDVGWQFRDIARLDTREHTTGVLDAEFINL